MKSALYSGSVYHKRRRPHVHELRYRVFSFLLSLDEIDALAKRFWLFSRNRWNLFSFYDNDFGDDFGDTLEDYVSRQLTLAGINSVPSTVLLSCYPRIFGYTFNPLSLFYCLDDAGELFAVLHEVHNTFGERHVYVLPVENSTNDTSAWIHQSSDKVLFVSPFAHMDMSYQFRLNLPSEKQVIAIKVFDDDGHLLTASYSATRQAMTVANLFKKLFSMPFLTVKVIVGIHWEALLLWIKKVPLVKHQSKEDYQRALLNKK